jgi:transcriptional regulator
MYVPEAFAEPDVAAMADLMRRYPLACLVTLGAAGLEANHIPLEWSETPAPWGSLRGHAARANPFWRDGLPGGEVLAVFHGPDAYVSPSWYASRRESGQVVPTWNYAVVHAYGRLTVRDDAVWLKAQLDRQIRRLEAAQPAPWSLSDAPPGFVDGLLPSIVGIEITVTRLQGKWKASQNRSSADRAGVALGLREAGCADAQAVAELVRSADD